MSLFPRSIVVALLLLLLGGCAGVSDSYRRPEPNVPAAWVGRPPDGAGQFPDRQWWSAFASAELAA